MPAAFLRHPLRWGALLIGGLGLAASVIACPSGQQQVCAGVCFCAPISQADIDVLYEDVSQIAASGLEQGLLQARQRAVADGTEPVPLHIRAQLEAYFDIAVLDSARFKVGGDEALNAGNALLQNVGSGNTMVFNTALLRLLRKVQPVHSVWHDWTAYQAVTGCGGRMHFDPEPCLLYRQHAHNQVGSQGRSLDKLERVNLLFKGQYRTWGDQTEAAMDDLAAELDADARRLLQNYRHMRRSPGLIQRLQAGWHSGLWRQTPSGRASLWLGLVLNQI